MSTNWTDNLDRDMNNLSTLTSGVSQKMHQRISILNAELETFKDRYPIVQKYPKIVCIDVGGRLFQSSVEVLTREPSYFSSMFSGRIMLNPDSFDGSYFIDRSPKYFPLVLKYLRFGKVDGLKKMDKLVKSEFAKEAEFYGMEGLLDLLGGKRKKTAGAVIFEFESTWDDNGLFRYFKSNEMELPVFDLVTNQSSSSNHYTIESTGSSTYNVPQEKARQICGYDADFTLTSPTTTGVNVVVIDIGEDYSFNVTDAVFSCRYSPTSYFANVKFYGSEDKISWDFIADVRVGHNTFTNNEKYHRYFKLDNPSSQTLVSGWEMYGELQ